MSSSSMSSISHIGSQKPLAPVPTIVDPPFSSELVYGTELADGKLRIVDQRGLVVLENRARTSPLRSRLAVNLTDMQLKDTLLYLNSDALPALKPGGLTVAQMRERILTSDEGLPVAKLPSLNKRIGNYSSTELAYLLSLNGARREDLIAAIRGRLLERGHLQVE